MSIRTLIEINHDYIREMETDPEGFIAELLESLREAGLSPFQHDGDHNGRVFTRKWSRHHSDDCPVDLHQRRR